MHAVATTIFNSQYIWELENLFNTENKKHNNALVFRNEVGHFLSQLSRLIEMGRIQQADDAHIHRAFLAGVGLGVSFDPRAGQAFVIPMFDELNDGYVPNFFLGYKGMLAIVARSSVVLTMTAEVVFENDEFVFNGTLEKPTHKFRPTDIRGNPIGVYGMSMLANGQVITSFMPADELYVIEESAKTNMNQAWNSPFINELRKKTGLRRHFKSLLSILELRVQENSIETEAYHAGYN